MTPSLGSLHPPHHSEIARETVKNQFKRWIRLSLAFKCASKSILDINIRDVRVKISNDTFSRKPGDRIKAVVHFCLEDYNGIQTMLTFEVKKKQEMKMLQTFAAETISNCFSKKEDIMYLGVPKQLLKDLNKAYDEIWRVDRRSISISRRQGHLT